MLDIATIASGIVQHFDVSIYLSLAFFFGIAAQFRAMDGYTLLRKLVYFFEKRFGILFGVAIITALFSPFILNDVLVLILTPVMIKYSKQHNIDIAPLVVAEISFTNIASSLTPLGNPQNILLWQASGISAGAFVLGTWFPLFLSGLIVLVILYQMRVNKTVLTGPSESSLPLQPAIYLVAVAIVVFSSNLIGISNVVALGFCFILGFLFTFRLLPKVPKEFDLKSLLILYALIASITVVAALIGPIVGQYATMVAVGKQPFSALFIGSLSQLISNVPTTQLILSLTHIPQHIAPKIAVQAGLAGNIDPISSFANILALLMVKRAGLPIRKALLLQLAIGLIAFLPALI